MDSCSSLKGFVPTYDDLWKSYKKSEMKIKDLRGQLQESRQKVEEVYKQKRITTKTDVNLQQKLAKAQEIAAESEKQINHLQKSNRSLDKKHEASLNEVAEYEMQLEVYNDMHLLSLEDKKSFSEQLKEMEEAKDKVQKYKRDLEGREEVALKEAVEYKTRNEENHYAFVKSDEERKSNSDRVAKAEESKARILKLGEETERLKNEELEESRKAIQQLKLEMDSIRKQLAETREDNEQLQRTSSELSRAIKIIRLEGKMDIGDKENTVSDLSEQIQTLSSENDLLKKKKKKCFLCRIFSCCFRRRRARR